MLGLSNSSSVNWSPAEIKKWSEKFKEENKLKPERNQEEPSKSWPQNKKMIKERTKSVSS